MKKKISFCYALRNLLNQYSIENESNTPDFILANYIFECLNTYRITVQNRDKWFNFKPFSKNELK